MVDFVVVGVSGERSRMWVGGGEGTLRREFLEARDGDGGRWTWIVGALDVSVKILVTFLGGTR